MQVPGSGACLCDTPGGRGPSREEARFIGLLLGGVDLSNFFAVLKAGEVAGPYPSLADAQAAGAVTINYGVFINAVVSFLIVAFAVFILIRAINRPQAKEEAPPAEPTTNDCSFCCSAIPIKATRCPNCTSEVGQDSVSSPRPS